MSTPPIPVDPSLDSWHNSSLTGLGVDHLLPHTSVTGLLERPGFGGLDAFPHDVQLPSMRQSDSDTNPLLRFYNDPGPWSSQRVVGDMGPPSTPPRCPGTYHQVNLPAAIQYRDSPRSDLDSNTTGRNPHDSGYESKSFATKSVRSMEHVDRSQECQSLASDVNEMQIYPGDQFQGQGSDPPPEVHYSYDMTESLPSLPPCPYLECQNVQFKNVSDQKYEYHPSFSRIYLIDIHLQKARSSAHKTVSMQ